MDGTLGSKTARHARRNRRRDHEPATSSRRSCAARRRAGFAVAVHAIGDQANRDALDAFEATPRSGARAACARGSSTRSSSRRRGPPALRRARRRRLGAVLPRTVGPRPRRRHLGGDDRPRVRVALAARRRRASSRTAPTRRSRSSTRSRASAPASCARSTSGPRWHPEQTVTVEEALHATTVAPAWLTRRRAPPRQAASRLPRRSRRARPRPGRRIPSSCPSAGRRHDARWPLGFRRSTLPLAPTGLCVYNSQQEPGALDEEGVPQPLPVLPGSSMVRDGFVGVQ